MLLAITWISAATFQYRFGRKVLICNRQQPTAQNRFMVILMMTLTRHIRTYIFVQALLRQQTATYISIGSLAFIKTVPTAVREKTALLMQFYTDYLQSTFTLRQYI